MMEWTGNHKDCLYDDGFARHVLDRDEAWTALKEPVSVWSVGQFSKMALHPTRHSREGGSP